MEQAELKLSLHVIVLPGFPHTQPTFCWGKDFQRNDPCEGESNPCLPRVEEE